MKDIDFDLLFDYLREQQEKVTIRTTNNKNECKHDTHGDGVCFHCGLVFEDDTIKYETTYEQEISFNNSKEIGSAISFSYKHNKLSQSHQRACTSNQKYHTCSYKNMTYFKQLINVSLSNKIAQQHLNAINKFIESFWTDYVKLTKTKGDNSKSICLIMIMMYVIDHIKEESRYKPLISSLTKNAALKTKYCHNGLSYVAKNFKEASGRLGINLNITLLSKLI